MTEVYVPRRREEDEKSSVSAAPGSPGGTSSGGSDNELEPMSDADATTEPECKPAPIAPLPPDTGLSSAEMPKKGKGKGPKKPPQPKGGVKRGKSAEAKIRDTKKKLFNIISSL
jgi:hypothetical protein